MRIGIDIDDTITNSWEYYIPIYSQIFNIPIEKIELKRPYFAAVKHKYTRDKFYQKLKPINDQYSQNIPIKEKVKEAIDKLYESGHSIVFITARNEDFIDPYKSSRQYLDKHQIKYDKIITYAYDKDRVCLEENIDIFIDDSVRNCKAVAEIGKEVILFDAPHNQCTNEFKRLNNWEDIVEYIENR